MATTGAGAAAGGLGGRCSGTGGAGVGAAGGRAGERLLGRFKWSKKFCVSLKWVCRLKFK